MMGCARRLRGRKLLFYVPQNQFMLVKYHQLSEKTSRRQTDYFSRNQDGYSDFRYTYLLCTLLRHAMRLPTPTKSDTFIENMAHRISTQQTEHITTIDLFRGMSTMA